MTPSSAPHDRCWSLQIFRMTSESRQQRALDVFARVGMPGVQVLDVVRSDEWFVIVDSPSIAAEVRCRRIVLNVDPSAVRVTTVAPRQRPQLTVVDSQPR